MQTPAKTMIACTAVSLLAVTTYSVAMGSNGWLWFTWVVLGLTTVGVIVTSEA
ncbi:hypothetical protein [Wenjunlia vitaminophila]|uniref:hypothetical protein n=1 Tax=Wenjunlia vitaminophila TaxID=76728 RepID=UPI0003659F4D|nr:hypothetical protein [Wenjunlia vitaminophila]